LEVINWRTSVDEIGNSCYLINTFKKVKRKHRKFWRSHVGVCGFLYFWKGGD
jgi:hypothetical protein